MSIRSLTALILATLLAAAAHAAPAVPPDRMSYQGVLLDDMGAPRTGPVDLAVRIYDTAAGGTLLYLQEYANVPLTDGVFSLEIGPTGSASDTPSDPLTTALLDVFAGDLVSAPHRFFELQVDAGAPLGRIQILSAPLALRAESAAIADTATTANTATTVTEIAGLDPATVSEIYEHFDFDGQAPPNTDPSEGLGDPDGDGIANFVDPDNDDDGIPDGDEVSQGSDINLVTPIVTDVSPDVADFGFPVPVTVSGQNFEPGIGVVFGSQSPAPSNVTATSFDVTVGPQAAGFPDVEVTRTNGESSLASGLFEFSTFQPTVTSSTPSSGFSNFSTPVVVSGTNFEPGMSVTFGTANVVPSNVTPTSFEATVGPHSEGLVSVTVTRLNGVSGTGIEIFDFLGAGAGNGVAHDLSDTPFTSFDVRDSGVSVIGEFVDTDLDEIWEKEAAPDPPSVVPGVFDIAFDGSGTMIALFPLTTSSTCDVQFRRDIDGNDRVFAGEGILIENFGGASCSVPSSSVGALSNDAGVAAYVRNDDPNDQQVMVAADLDDDDDFGDAGELVQLDTGVHDVTVDVAVGPSDGLAVAWAATRALDDEVWLAHDRNADGDFDDALENVLVHMGATSCVATAVDPAGRAAVLFQDTATDGVTLLHDLDGDGDFDGAGESQEYGTGTASNCAMISLSTGLALVHDAWPNASRLLRDLDGDGTFNGADENVSSVPGAASGLNLAADSSDQVYVVSGSEFLIAGP